MKNVYINSIKQISSQLPLTEEWFETPLLYSEDYVRAIDPDFKQYLAPNTARRLGKILKRALIVSQMAMEESGVSNPDAIITGTGLGCIENTELFLDKLVKEGEELLNPTQFMQSTHNTISSLVAIETKCHNYNTTYAHKGVSFECALQDAFLQLSRNDKACLVATALVGAHDEMTPAYFTLLKKAGYLGKSNQSFAAEIAVAMMLSNQKTETTLCQIEAVEKYYKILPPPSSILHYPFSIDAVMTGINGDPETDQIYFNNCSKMFPNIPLLHYKNLFGECYTAPAIGVYVSAVCLKRGEVPIQLQVASNELAVTRKKINNILCYNHFEGKNHTFILLSNPSC